MSYNIEIIDRALNVLSKHRCDNRVEWLMIGMAVHAATDGAEAGFIIWDRWSQKSERYTSGCTRQQWRSFKAGRGISVATLFHLADIDSPGWRESSHPTRFKPAVSTCAFSTAQNASKQYFTDDEAIRTIIRFMGRNPDYQWEYLDCEWEICGYVLRWNNPDGAKTFRPVSRLGNDRWIIGHMPGLRPLYRLPFIRDLGFDTSIWVCEGEKAADALVSIGIEATTSAGGAQAAQQTRWEPLAGRSIIICPDADEAGEVYAKTVTAILHKQEPPAIVKVLRLPGAAKSDAYDFIHERRNQLVRE